jgi:hypothetical protein
MLKSKTILMNMVTSGLLAFNMTRGREVRKVFKQLGLLFKLFFVCSAIRIILIGRGDIINKIINNKFIDFYKN